MRAFADESFGRFRSLSMYVMCAALIEDSELEGIRLAMRSLRKGSTKLHWYELAFNNLGANLRDVAYSTSPWNRAIAQMIDATSSISTGFDSQKAPPFGSSMCAVRMSRSCGKPT